MARTSEPGRSTASRLFAVLAAFERAEPVMTLTVISERAKLPLATTYRILRELVTVGAVERNADGTYQIGLRLWELGSLAPRQRQLRRLARPVMESLHEVTGETVQLAVFDGVRALTIEKVSGSRSATNITEVAGGLPLHATGVGKVILAFADHPGLARLRGRRLRRFTPNTITVWEALSEEIQAVERDGVAYSREEMTLGTASVAAPVFDAQDGFAAALGILTASPLALRRLAGPVQKAAQEISLRLGHRPAASLRAVR